MDLKIGFIFSFLCLTKEKNETLSHLPFTINSFKKVHSSLLENAITSAYLSYSEETFLIFDEVKNLEKAYERAFSS